MRYYWLTGKTDSLGTARPVASVEGPNDGIIKIFEVHASMEADASEASNENIEWLIERATVPPSAGDTATPVAVDPGDPTFNGVCRIPTGTVAISGETAATYLQVTDGSLNGLHLVAPDHRPLMICMPSDALVLSTDQSHTAAIWTIQILFGVEGGNT